MSKCQTCTRREVCRDCPIDSIPPNARRRALENLSETCKHYQDEALTVVLPCKGGDLHDMLNDLTAVGLADSEENYHYGYRNGFRNGRIELLKYILQIVDEAQARLEELKHDIS